MEKKKKNLAERMREKAQQASSGYPNAVSLISDAAGEGKFSINIGDLGFSAVERLRGDGFKVHTARDSDGTSVSQVSWGVPTGVRVEGAKPHRATPVRDLTQFLTELLPFNPNVKVLGVRCADDGSPVIEEIL